MKLARRWRGRAAGAGLCALLLAACGGASPPGSGTPNATPIPPGPGAVFDVTHYGASGDGQTDNTNAFTAAVSAAEHAGGGTVYVPPGTYAFSAAHTQSPASVGLVGATGITLQGAGRDLTRLVEMHHNKPLVTVRVDGSVVEDLTLDTQSHGGGAAISVVANRTKLLHLRVLGGSGHFAIYFVGPKGASPQAPAYNVGNAVDDLQLNDLDCNDGFSWSFQHDGSISNITHTGSRLALYMDTATTVTNYDYTPGQQQCGARNGFWLTPPASDITIVNFVSSGQGGKIGVISAAHAGRVADHVTIRGLTMTASGQSVTIGDVRNLLLSNCNLGSNTIVVAAQETAQGTVTGCHYGELLKRSAPLAQVSIAVVNSTA